MKLEVFQNVCHKLSDRKVAEMNYYSQQNKDYMYIAIYIFILLRLTLTHVHPVIYMDVSIQMIISSKTSLFQNRAQVGQRENQSVQEHRYAGVSKKKKKEKIGEKNTNRVLL